MLGKIILYVQNIAKEVPLHVFKHFSSPNDILALN
jgi:hypothetical protein